MNNRIFISVVSHGHGSLLSEMDTLSKLNDNIYVIVKNNTYDRNLIEYCKLNDVDLIDINYNQGFGKNNNEVYDYCCKKYNMSQSDVFIVMNPDVDISPKTIFSLVDKMEADSVSLATINLYKDLEQNIPDNSIRTFPTLTTFFQSFVFGVNTSCIEKKPITKPVTVDWAAGSFLAFKPNHYATLNGFDVRYFMYCEDIDICYRSYLFGQAVTYYPQFTALHLAKHNNRKIFSKHFYWHIISAMRFLIFKSFNQLKR